MKTCIACGMPMYDPSEFAMGDENKNYCIHCARANGSMQSFEEKRAGLTKFTIETQGLDKTAALSIAEGMMEKLPAWKNHFQTQQ